MQSGHREAALAGRIVAITGAASGIGRALAIDCAKQGATLALADVGPGLLTIRTELAELGLSAIRLLTHEVDVRNREQVAAWADDTLRELGSIDVIVNAAGVSLHCPLDETTPEDFEWVMTTNFWGTVHGTQAFLPQFQRQGHGHVINLSSVFGLMAFPASGAYVASKFAVRGFTETLSLELALSHPRIRVTCVHPGGVQTPLVRNGRVRGRGPLSRSPDDVALAFDRSLARTSASECARQITAVMQGETRRLLVGVDARLLDWVVRLFPSFYQRALAWILRRSARPGELRLR